ncbi:unnamed protein product [Ectocarpus sp. 12 AP-2014]
MRFVIREKLRGHPWLFFVEICQTSCRVKMAMPPDRLEQRIRTMTRSGRSVRPPIRYEPDSEQVLEDDFSEEESDWGCVEEAQTDWGSGDQQPTDSEQSEFTQSDSDDSSYQSTSDSSSSEEAYDSDTSSIDLDEDETAGGEEEDEDDVDDVLAWETLTIDASDDYSSADDQDL